MIYVNILFGILTVAAIILFFVKSSRHTKKQDEINRRFLEEEDAANAVRKKDIEPELYFTADLSVFPQLPEGDPFQVERCAKRTMIRFEKPVSNLELKKEYGPTQMDIIAQYEENFNEYLKSLTKWAKALSEEENNADALSILEKVILLGAEFRDTYKLAADICAAKQDAEGLDTLLELVSENYFRDPAIRTQILEYINTKKEEFA
ncbi:MAG: hypothetical protein FWF79_03920 [Defluviitaleaceae bacterium]|nr:hypothetical protein [Defluviitaleaceae bacterium]